MTTEKGIWIITNDNYDSGESSPETNASSKGFFDDNLQTDYENQGGIVPVNKLQENLAQLLNDIDESLAKIDGKATQSDFQIDEIELAVGINGKGKVGIWGIGAEAGSNASIKLKLKRKS